MKLKTIFAATLAISVVAGAVVAAEEPQVVRQELMEGVGKAMGGLVGIVKGKSEYNADVVKASLTTIADAMKTFPDHFPAGSETGAKTEASPKIWENMDDFKAKAAKLGTDANALLAALPADTAAVGEAVKVLGAGCAACHETYRVKE